MLIDFRVKNYRSIREQQTFSLVASKAVKDMPNCLIERDLLGMKGVRFLSGAAIYGANASGKSNVLEAMGYLGWLVRKSAVGLQSGDGTGVQPFKLDANSSREPSEFEVTFVANDNVRYMFELTISNERVLSECLVAFPKGVPQRWYERRYDIERKTYEWSKPSSAFKFEKALQDKTRENSLFLSVGPQFNHPQLTPVFEWFKTSFRVLNLGASELYYGFTVEQLERQSHHDRIINLLRSADVGVADVKIERKEISLDELKRHLPPSALADMESAGGGLKTRPLLEVTFTHQVDGKDPVPLDFNQEESEGTRSFFSLIGPWTDILDNGYTVFIDELETSLHPILVRELLKLLFSRETNKKGAQIVFTTHNPLLLDSGLLRRDQVWFTEKTPAGTTQLYSLTDSRPRKGEALAKGYLAGRYGGIPYLPEGLKW